VCIAPTIKLIVTSDDSPAQDSSEPSSRPGLDPYPDPYGPCFMCLMRLLEVPGERG
jgi:hypothetical protein